MGKYIVADTNIWYAIADGKLDPNELKAKGKLCATPLSLIEIGSGVNDDTFTQRQKAASAMISYADIFLKSINFYLAQYLGYKGKPEIDWIQGAVTITKATSPKELIEGFTDFQDKVTRKQNTPFLNDWKKQQYNDFKQKIIELISNIHPDYITQTENGKEQLLPLTDEIIIKLFDTEEFFMSGKNMAYERMKMCVRDDYINRLPKTLNKKLLETLENKLDVYLKVYAQYIKVLVTTPAKPDGNDLGDFEVFMYLQNKNWILATRDKRWAKIAQKVCPNQLIDLSEIK